MRIHHVDNKSELVLEDALTPILVVTWIGPATLRLVANFQQWGKDQIALAKAHRSPIIMVNDATHAGRPAADVRRAFADLELDGSVIIRSYVVMSNPMVRGAMTAIGWMVGSEFRNICCETTVEALDQAAAHVRSLGLYGPTDGEFVRFWARAPVRASSG